MINMTIARRNIADSETAGFYHCTNCCVSRAKLATARYLYRISTKSSEFVPVTKTRRLSKSLSRILARSLSQDEKSTVENFFCQLLHKLSSSRMAVCFKLAQKLTQFGTIATWRLNFRFFV